MFDTFFKLGYHHLMSIGAWDHLLFLATIALAYQASLWRKWVVLATIFALGHTASLLALTLGLLPLRMGWVEPAIAMSIVVLALVDLLALRSASPKGSAGNSAISTNNPFVVSSAQHRLLVLLVLLFGFIHGLGFGGNFVPMLMSDLSVGEMAWSLLAFTLGVETAQLLILLAYWIAAFLVFELWQFHPLLLRRVLLVAIALAGAVLFIVHLGS